jgi:lipopolysaccharide/colanic/teichoic acid biosynthesis glycosyltransferase
VLGFQDSQLIILRDEICNDSRVKTAVADPLIFNALLTSLLSSKMSLDTSIAIPASLALKTVNTPKCVYTYDNTIDFNLIPAFSKTGWSIITNGRYVSNLDVNWARRVAQIRGCDLLMVNVDDRFVAQKELIKTTSDNRLAGIRRIYSDCVVPACMPDNWPYMVIIRSELISTFAGLDYDFATFKKRISKLKIEYLNFGAELLDISVLQDLHRFLLSNLQANGGKVNKLNAPVSYRLIGPVLVDPEAIIEKDSVVAGPAIIGKGAIVGRNSIIVRSILASGQSIKPNAMITDQVILPGMSTRCSFEQFDFDSSGKNFRQWAPCSYPRLAKRVADMLISAAVLLLFAPVILIIAMLVKITSPGPAFFGDKRQGLHGKDFSCYKFRSMVPGADKLQQKLRKLNEVDGPQFKMEFDPRVTTIGRFLRNTYLDEIPQFWNVLTGKMSIVGPRPSPEAENSLCASWRDARLSVRPGITGLWQVCRTRLPGTDFHEWVYFDKMYVKNISLSLDIWICWKTALYILHAFLRQF